MFSMLEVFRQNARTRLLLESENVQKLPGRTLQGKKGLRNQGPTLGCTIIAREQELATLIAN